MARRGLLISCTELTPTETLPLSCDVVRAWKQSFLGGDKNVEEHLKKKKVGEDVEV